MLLSYINSLIHGFQGSQIVKGLVGNFLEAPTKYVFFVVFFCSLNPAIQLMIRCT